MSVTVVDSVGLNVVFVVVEATEVGYVCSVLIVVPGSSGVVTSVVAVALVKLLELSVDCVADGVTDPVITPKDVVASEEVVVG